jgi:HTH-type transcriptional regulator, glycine betaine synthesis regulator
MDSSPVSAEFARFAGELAESLSFNRSVGQIYGLLYLSDTPLSLEEIAKRLRMSKGNASINLRALEGWGAVRSVWVEGSRRDHYEANRDIKAIATRRIEEGLTKRIDLAERSMDRLLSQANGDPHLRKRLQSLRSMVQTGRRMTKLLPKLAGFLPG